MSTEKFSECSGDESRPKAFSEVSISSGSTHSTVLYSTSGPQAG